MDAEQLIREAVARAAAEFGGAAGGKVGDKLADLIERLAGDAVDALGPRLAAAVRAPEPAATGLDAVIARWRARNVVLALAGARALLDARGVEARQVPAAFLVPLLDEAARVVDEPLRECWATLLANGIDDEAARRPMNVRALAALSVEDLALFRKACANADARGVPFGNEGRRPAYAHDHASDEEGRLVALGLVVPWTRAMPEMASGRGTPFGEPLEVVVGLGVMPTRFGAAFRRAALPRVDESRPPFA